MIAIKIDKGQYLLNAAAGFQLQVFGESQSRAARQIDCAQKQAAMNC